MATFGKDFVRSATQPAYLQGLFTAAQGLGSAPRRRREEKQAASLQKGLFGLEQMALSGELDPEMYKEAVGSYTALMQQSPEQADEIRKSLARVGASVREQDKAQKKVTAVNELSAIETEYTKIYSDPSLNTTERDARAAALRTRAKGIQDANPLVDFSSFSNWDSRAMNAGMAISSRVQNQEAEVEQQKVDTTLQGMTPKEREDYVETYTGSESEYMLRRINSLNTYDEGVQRRAGEAATRKQNLNTEIDNLTDEIATIQSENLRESLTRELNVVKKMQEGGYKNGSWDSKGLQNQANNKLNDLSRRIINHSDRVADADRRSIRETDIKITALESQLDNPVIDQKILDRYAKSAASEAGNRRPFDKISASKKEEYYDQARANILRDHNQGINAQIRTQKAVRNYLSGEQPEEQSTTETTTFSTAVDEAVAETGRSRLEVITALKKRGDIPKDYSEKKQSFEESIELSETEVITALFGEQGYVLPLGLTTESVSKALLEDRVYYALNTNASLAGVSTNDLEILQYDDNKYTPRIKAELKRRGR